MPELPEVETTRLGILPHIQGFELSKIHIYQRQLRWPVPSADAFPSGDQLQSITRRGKYLIFSFTNINMLVHLGMSGSLRIDDPQTDKRKHDHLEFIFRDKAGKTGNKMLRYHDPRRFGCILLTQNYQQHKLIKNLGVEPLSPDFSATFLYQQCRKRKTHIKSVIMNSTIITGIGNIYANEALFLAAVNPCKSANRLKQNEAAKLVAAIQTILRKAINQGGTTLRDFGRSDGKPGYFQQQLYVYSRGGQACKRCSNPISTARQNNRSTFWCQHCQH